MEQQLSTKEPNAKQIAEQQLYKQMACRMPSTI